MTADLLLTDLHVVTLAPRTPDLGRIHDAAIAIEGGRIAWVGRATDAPNAAESLSFGGRWVTPGLVDCHTHLIFGGSRLDEFEQRLEGATYEELARAGGGILSTVAATRAASDEQLLADAVTRVRWLISNGVTTVEVKSGYGLEVETELRMLRIARSIPDVVPVDVVVTLLGAHAVPAEFAGDRGGYVAMVCDEMIPAVAAEGLADAVDVFCDGIGFTLAETERIMDAAIAAGLPVKVHAAQLTDLGAVTAAAARGALSVDHLEHLPVSGIEPLHGTDTVAVLVPGAAYFLGDEAAPPVDALRDAGVAMAVATDLNPGSSPVASLLTACSLAAHRFGLTVDECLVGVTRNAAQALALSDIGHIAAGMTADLAIWDVADPAELVYWVGAPLCHATVRSGTVHFAKERTES